MIERYGHRQSYYRELSLAESYSERKFLNFEEKPFIEFGLVASVVGLKEDVSHVDDPHAIERLIYAVSQLRGVERHFNDGRLYLD